MLILHNHKMEELSGDLDKQSVIAKAQIFMKDGCGCRQGSQGGQCSDQFTEESVLANLYSCLELSHRELDLIVLANIQAFSAVARLERLVNSFTRNGCTARTVSKFLHTERPHGSNGPQFFLHG